MAKALLFPTTLDSLGDRGSGLSTEVWWTPNYPFKSTLTGQTPAQFCAQWEKEMGRQWTQPIGFQHSLFEVVVDVIKRTKNIDSRESVLEAVRTTNIKTIMGPIQFNGQPVKNVCRTPLVGGQWVRTQGKKYKYELLVVNNDNNKLIPTQATLKPL
jgi:branched-chain amino acid transport system substrate-binding protein